MMPRLHHGLTPLADALGARPLFGDIHNHCGISYGHGSLDEALARAALQLDFVSVTGHAHWPDMPVNDPAVAHIVDFHVKGFARLRAGWMEHFRTLAAADNERFAVFPGYEIHSAAHGDYTILYRDLSPAPLILADDPAALRRALHDAHGDAAFAFPHHVGYRVGARGINWASFDPALSPFVEIMSMHGCAEESTTDLPYLHSMGPGDGEGTLRHGLARGEIFGVVGNTDHHSAFPGSYGHGRLCAFAADRSREALWQALRGRHTNALTGDNIHLLASIGGTIQGGIMPPQEHCRLDIEAVAGGFIDSIDIHRNGALAHRITPELQPSPISAAPETILFLECGWGARGSAHRWDCELAIEGGEILGVEPRLRGLEIVSPLEGKEGGAPLPEINANASRLSLRAEAHANPNNRTPAMQGIAARLRIGKDTRISARLDGQRRDIPLSRLFAGALSGNLGPIDSPAWRLNALPLPHQWQWRGAVDLGRLDAGEAIHLRLRQRGGQMAWTSPIFCRE